VDLKNFVSEALYQIVAGIKSAQGKIKEFSDKEESKMSIPSIAPQAEVDDENELHDVHFEIALVVEEATPTTARLAVMGLSMIGKGSLEHIGSFVSRVKFSVPLGYSYMKKPPYISSHFKGWGLNNPH
jgi:hypothetical protein